MGKRFEQYCYAFIQFEFLYDRDDDIYVDNTFLVLRY